MNDCDSRVGPIHREGTYDVKLTTGQTDSDVLRIPSSSPLHKAAFRVCYVLHDMVCQPYFIPVLESDRLPISALGTGQDTDITILPAERVGECRLN